MSGALLVFASSTFAFGLCVMLFTIERSRGERLVAARIRSYLDSLLLQTESRLQRLTFWYHHLVLRWGWRYSIHMVLRSILVGISQLYDWLVARFEQNLQVTKALRRERKRWYEQKEEK